MAKMSACKRGLSAVVTTLILVSVSMAAVAIVWGVTNSMIKSQIKESESCFGNYDKIKLNGQYTCYIAGGSNDYTLRFSISVGDIKVDKVIVSVSSDGLAKSYTIANGTQTISGLTEYPSGSATIHLPEKNSGRSYEASGFTGMIDSVQVAPVIGGTQCEVSDGIYQIEQCEIE